ncbi:MAG: primosomal protein N' [Planctomycetaceae bacterium]|nr:primosomal protein N' [Planctomycetaceae bacterium]
MSFSSRRFLVSSQQSLFDFADMPEWEQAAEQEVRVADVVFNLPLERPYTYLIPEALQPILLQGQRIRAPLGRGNRTVVGYCVGVRNSPVPQHRLKEIEEVLDRDPLLDPLMLELTKWIGERYLCGWGQVLESVIPAGVRRKSGTRLVQCYTASADAAERIDQVRISKKQKLVLDLLFTAGTPVAAAEICERCQCGPSVLTSLRRKNLITPHRIRSELAGDWVEGTPQTATLELSTQQSLALKTIVEAIQSQQHRTFLLHGVTGSGKTEVYIRSIQEVVSYGRQAIVLVPEISLTPQTIRRFRSRFQSVAVLHSHMSDAERHWQWQQIATGNVQVIVGARSAVFAPAPHLGLIVIDEEHEPTFKQDTTPRYHAREVARHRCEQNQIPLVLGSATPTLESWLRVQRNLDTLISMPDRVAELPLPPVVVVDTRNDPRIARGTAIGRALHQAIGKALADKGQVILFLNLRGYSPSLWCRSCGTGIKCPDCDITLTWHRDRGEAVCHSCDYHVPPPERCPTCESPAIRYLGIGTQKLDEEVRTSFPDAEVLRMDSDSMKKPGSHDEALERFRKGEVQILLGTQMIAKGLDFPNVTLVGVVDADTMLRQPDMRATERTFQLIAQVAGRTGRSSRGGRVLVQTTCPEDPAVQFASRHDFEGFARYELAQRHDAMAPPFSSVARVIFRGPVESVVLQTAQTVADKLRTAQSNIDDRTRILGPAPAPITRLRGLWRFHLMISGKTAELVRQLWQSVEATLQLPDGVEMQVDVDPVSSR